MDAIVDGRCDGRAEALTAGTTGGQNDTAEAWHELLACKPTTVDAGAWAGLFEYALAKMLHLLGPRQVQPFVHDALDPVRFAHLERQSPARLHR